jgi:hypothetical protein
VRDKTKARIRWVKPIDGLAGLALFFPSIIFFYDLFRDRFLLTERDLGPYFIPPRLFWVDSIRNLDFPLWDPYQFTGHPFFANPQYAVLYPFNSLFFMLPFDVAFNTVIILHFFLGGFFIYLLLKDLKVNPTGSLISGLIFMLSGYLLSVHSLLNCLLSVIWTPLIMMFFRRALANPGSKSEVFTALFITLSFLGGGIEIIYGNFLVLLFMVIFSTKTADSRELHLQNGTEPVPGLRRWTAMGRPFRYFIIRFRGLFLVVILFLLFSAIQLIPFLELWIHSIRGKGISYQEATMWSFSPKDILLFFLPDAYGYFLDMKRYWVTQCWLKTLYAGGLPFILSLIFFLSPPSPLSSIEEKEFGKDRRFYFSLIILSLFLSLGQYNPLYPFVYNYVPFFSGIRYPVKFLYIFILILSVTAGLGWQRLVEFSKEGETRTAKNFLLLLAFISCLLFLFLALGHKEVEHFLRERGIDFPDLNYLSVNLFHAKRFLFYLTLFFLVLRIGHEVKWKGWARVFLIFFLVADLFGNIGFYEKEKASEYFRKTRILQIISADTEAFRVFSTGKTICMESPVLIDGSTPLNIYKEKHLPTMNLLYRLHDIWGIDVVRLKKVDELYHALIGAPSISATNLLDLYGVKYIVSLTPLGDDRRLQLIYSRVEGLKGRREDLIKENTIKLYKKGNVFPRAWLVKGSRVLGSKEILERLKSKAFHPDREVLLEENPASLALPHKGGGKGKDEVMLISESNNRLLLRVRATENCFLVLSDTYFPGWKVYVDGKEEKIYRANYTFRAVSVPAGNRKVEFIYKPMSFKIGAVGTILGITGCLAIGLRKKKRREAHARVAGTDSSRGET